MHVSEDGKSLIPDEFDRCRWQAADLVRKWIEAHPGKIVILDDAKDSLVHSIGFAIWEAKEKSQLLPEGGVPGGVTWVTWNKT